MTRCRLGGELDAATAGEMFAAVARALDGRADVLELHLDELDFCDAAGVTALLEMQDYAEAHRTLVKVCGARGIVRRVFEIVELNRAMRVV